MSDFKLPTALEPCDSISTDGTGDLMRAYKVLDARELNDDLRRKRAKQRMDEAFERAMNP